MNIPPLRYGPYRPPNVRRGDMLDDVRSGPVVVGGYTDAPIPWPRVLRAGRAQCILCGDLIKAVQHESELAVAYWWGVGVVTVWAWRKALGVPRMTDGTCEVYREIMPAKLPDEAAARGRCRAKCMDSVARMAAKKEGVPTGPPSRATRRKLAVVQVRRWHGADALLSIARAARYLGMPYQYLWAEAQIGRLAMTPRGKRRMVRVRDLWAWLQLPETRPAWLDMQQDSYRRRKLDELWREMQERTHDDGHSGTDS